MQFECPVGQDQIAFLAYGLNQKCILHITILYNKVRTSAVVIPSHCHTTERQNSYLQASEICTCFMGPSLIIDD